MMPGFVVTFVMYGITTSVRDFQTTRSPNTYVYCA